MIVCLCMVATHEDIADAISDGAHTIEQVGDHCGAGTGCGACSEYIAEMIDKSGSCCPGPQCSECPRANPELRELHTLSARDAA